MLVRDTRHWSLVRRSRGMIVAANAPEFLPYLGFWNRLLHADVFVILDTVRFRHRYYHNRNRIRTEDSWTWFSIPVNKRNSGSIRYMKTRPFSEVERAWSLVEYNYKDRADYWQEYGPDIRGTLRNSSLFALNIDLINLVAGWLGIETKVMCASEVTTLVSEDAATLSLNVVESLGADTYLSGAGSIGTIPARFSDRNIDFLFQEFLSIPYPQIYPGWHPRMSVLDCLLTHGADYTYEIIRRGWEPEGKQ